jgi:hypothetical protein
VKMATHDRPCWKHSAAFSATGASTTSLAAGRTGSP